MAGEINAIANGATTSSENLADAFITDLRNASSQQENLLSGFDFGGFDFGDIENVGGAAEQLQSLPDDVFGEAASPEDQLLAALDENAAQRSSSERDAYRQEHGYDPSEGQNGLSWDEVAEITYEREGQIDLLPNTRNDPPTAPSGTDGMTLSEAREAIQEVYDRYAEESESASPALERQRQYIEEQLRILNDYQNNPGDTPTEKQNIDTERAIGFLQAQHDFIGGEVVSPEPDQPKPETPDALPDPAEGPIDPERTGDAPVVPEPEPNKDGPQGPAEGDPAPGEPDDDEDEGGIATPDPSKDPQPTGDGIEDIFGGVAVRPETVTPLPDGIEIPSNFTFPTAITGGGQAGAGTTTPVEGGIAILDVTDFDPRSLADGLVVNTTTTTPVDNVVVGNFGGVGGVPLGGEGPDPRAEDLDTLLESFDFSSVDIGRGG